MCERHRIELLVLSHAPDWEEGLNGGSGKSTRHKESFQTSATADQAIAPIRLHRSCLVAVARKSLSSGGKDTDDEVTV